MTTARGSRPATSVGGTLTGRGGNLVIIDDPLKPQEAQSQSARDSLKQWYSNTLLSRLDHKTEGSIIVVMQRLHLMISSVICWSRKAGGNSTSRRSRKRTLAFA